MEVLNLSGVARAQAALALGKLIVIPTDTVYGLAAQANDEKAVRRLYRLKGRDIYQPTSVIFSSISQLLDVTGVTCSRTMWAIRALLPGPWTLIIDVPDLAWPWVTGGRVGPMGVRVPATALDIPPVAATSANLAGAPTSNSISELDERLVKFIAVAIEAGSLDASNESTVIDITGWSLGKDHPKVLRDTAGRALGALNLLASCPAKGI